MPSTYTEGLEVIDGQGISVEVEQSILQHASVSVAVKGVRSVARHYVRTFGERMKQTYERTKRSRFNHLGFLGLNFMNLLKRTWATGAMPL